MKKLSLLLLLCIIGMFSACKDKKNTSASSNNNSSNTPIYALDISKETDWDYLIVANSPEGSSVWFNVNQQTNIPTTMFFKPFKDYDYGCFVKFRDNGLPEIVVLGDTIVVFENFDGTKVDFAVIYPNISIKYFYNIETGVDWNELKNFNRKNTTTEGSIAFEHSIKFIGTALSIVGAAAVIFNPAGVAGIGIWGAITIGSAMISVANNYWINNFAVGASSTLAGKVATTIGCLDIRNTYAQISCISGLASFPFSAASDAFAYANSKKEMIDISKEELKKNDDNGDDDDDGDDDDNGGGDDDGDGDDDNGGGNDNGTSLIGYWTLTTTYNTGEVENGSLTLLADGKILGYDTTIWTGSGYDRVTVSGTWELTENNRVSIDFSEKVVDALGYIELTIHFTGTHNTSYNKITGSIYWVVKDVFDGDTSTDSGSGTFTMNKTSKKSTIAVPTKVGAKLLRHKHSLQK
jgi:hypothetical protein